MAKQRLTKTEQAAKAFCERLQTYGGGKAPDCYADLSIEWVRNRTWGLCPRLEYGRNVLARATGSGYCKHSTVLAEALRWLGRDDDERMRIWQTGGAGVSSVERALLAAGWKLESTGSGRTFDGHRISRIEGSAQS